ncbi:hypothetical protein M9H77_25781 [Catharanthus roseus]|uniref:Uncharacterized protein n=1 Tax=Catharanthus roseus TaxID=4058 RepID=A0ACC0AAG2_CATRO|nr:hypothetical protein M9H77_25781 [Catharanthus roseus]
MSRKILEFVTRVNFEFVFGFKIITSGFDHVFESVRGLHCMWLVSRTRASSYDVDDFRLWRVDPLERGHNTVEGLAQSVLRKTLYHALRWDSRVVESQEGLEIKLFVAGVVKQSAWSALVLDGNHGQPFSFNHLLRQLDVGRGQGLVKWDKREECDPSDHTGNIVSAVTHTVPVQQLSILRVFPVQKLIRSECGGWLIGGAAGPRGKSKSAGAFIVFGLELDVARQGRVDWSVGLMEGDLARPNVTGSGRTEAIRPDTTRSGRITKAGFLEGLAAAGPAWRCCVASGLLSFWAWVWKVHSPFLLG